MSHRVYIERLIITVVIFALALLFWQLRHIFILVFGAVLVGVILRSIARPFTRWGLGEGWALLLAVLLLLSGIGVAFFIFGAQVIGQASALTEAIPAAWEAIRSRLAQWGLADEVQSWLGDLNTSVLTHVTGAASTFGGGLANALLIIVGGVYFAAQPRLYKIGIIKLVPAKGRELTDQALDDSVKGLRLWMLGQLVSMVIVGLLTGLGLWLLGVPLALTLGLLAGILDFVPIVGPIIAAFPAVLLALVISPEMALWTALLYLVVQQIEGNIVAPIVQLKAVDLPPALLLFALVAFGLLFGIPGVLFAAPLTAVLYILVKRLYVRETLNTATPMPTEKGEEEEGDGDSSPAASAG